jgi:hypothetical protein
VGDSSSGGGSSAALANEIRAARDEESFDAEAKTKYIKRKLDALSEEQLNRFEFFVRSHLSRGKIKEILSKTLGSKYTVTDDMAIVCGGLSKLLVGELIDISVTVMKESGLENGIQPAHIEEAHRRMQRDGKIGRIPDKAFMFSAASMIHAHSELAVYDDSSGDEAAIEE